MDCEVPNFVKAPSTQCWTKVGSNEIKEQTSLLEWNPTPTGNSYIDDAVADSRSVFWGWIFLVIAESWFDKAQQWTQLLKRTPTPTCLLWLWLFRKYRDQSGPEIQLTFNTFDFNGYFFEIDINASNNLALLNQMMSTDGVRQSFACQFLSLAFPFFLFRYFPCLLSALTSKFH
jgi:hypothetical protein